MKQLVTAVALIAFIISSSAHAQSPNKHKTIEQLVKALSEAYAEKTLGTLDVDRPYVGKVRIVIEHSLAEDTAKDRFVVRSFTSLAKAERWLKSREREEMPGRGDIKPLKRCAKGVCTFDFDSGILHNNLYLKKVTYGYRNARTYIKTILLLNGD